MLISSIEYRFQVLKSLVLFWLRRFDCFRCILLHFMCSTISGCCSSIVEWYKHSCEDIGKHTKKQTNTCHEITLCRWMIFFSRRLRWPGWVMPSLPMRDWFIQRSQQILICAVSWSPLQESIEFYLYVYVRYPRQKSINDIWWWSHLRYSI